MFQWVKNVINIKKQKQNITFMHGDGRGDIYNVAIVDVQIILVVCLKHFLLVAWRKVYDIEDF